MRNTLFLLITLFSVVINVVYGFNLAIPRHPCHRTWTSAQVNERRIQRKSSMSLMGLTEETLLPAVTNKPLSNLTKRSLTGVVLGALGTSWITSRNHYFGSGFLAASYVMHDEFNNMAKHTGVYPSFKLGVVASLLCHVSSVVCPSLHEIVIPTYFAILMMSLVFSNNKPTNLSQISTSVLGVLYTGYLPSFWVRLHGLPLPYINKNAVLTAGAAAIWWSWAAIASSDVGAYFVGNKFGRHKLSTVSTAAGHASPNKSVEGALAGVLSSSLVSALGAYAMRWPLWPVTGALYGLVLGTLGLAGDLTASAMKRDAGIKDTGSLLPGHGGLLDRFDSYILSAPLAFFFFRDVLPLVHKTIKV